MENKIIRSKRELAFILNKARKNGKKIAAISGSFDLLHLGHLELLKKAKSQGDVLIVLLNSDQSIKNYKGPNRPIINQEERAVFLSHFDFVDFVFIFDELNPNAILELVKPDIYCQGGDWGKNCIEREVVEKNQGQVHVIERKSNHSSSDIISRVQSASAKKENKAIFLDRDGTININQPEYVHRISDFRFAPGALETLRFLSQTDYKIVILTNQSGIGRGYYNQKDFERLNSWMLKELKKQRVRIDYVYHCPHHPNDKCSCRKPQPGMLLKAVEDFNINLSKSWIIGDQKEDVLLGRNANVQTIKIGSKMSPDMKIEPNYYVKNLLEAVGIVFVKGN